jgi:hypothetical protein
MPISAMDETLAHQTPETFDRVSTSDRNFYDRYYFNLHPRSGDLFVVIGIGQYPNLGTTDAFACVVHGGRQTVVRCSRELGVDRSDTRVGPFGVEVVEPLKSLRFYCEENEEGIEFDLVFTGRGPAVEEPRTLVRKGPRITMDTSRYTQMGHWEGSLSLKGKQFDITPDEFLGIRDHSWGVRPVGEAEPMGINIREYIDNYGFFHIFVPMQFEDFQLKVFLEENADGSLIVEECIKVETFENGGAVHQLGKPSHRINYASGSREFESAELHFTDEQGKPLVVTCEALTAACLAAGTGYVANPEWVHGQYHGPFKLESVEVDVSTPEKRAGLGPIYEHICRFELNTGEVGYGMFENLSVGHHFPYGFDSFEAVAK